MEQDLMTILIQTGFNLERMFQDKAIKKEAYTVLKYRNDLAIAELKTREAETTNESSGLHKHDVKGSFCDCANPKYGYTQPVCFECRREVKVD